MTGTSVTPCAAACKQLDKLPGNRRLVGESNRVKVYVCRTASAWLVVVQGFGRIYQVGSYEKSTGAVSRAERYIERRNRECVQLSLFADREAS